MGVILGGVTGCLPLTVSGAPELCTTYLLPIFLGFLIIQWWFSSLARLAMAFGLPLCGLLVRLLLSSLHDRLNWFAHLYRGVIYAGFNDPYVRQPLLTLFFPVLVTVVTVVMFIVFQRKGYAKDAYNTEP
jgi:hypothetical protein